MRLEGGIYYGKEGRVYLPIYNNESDIYTAPPPCIRGHSIYLAHDQYSFDGHTKCLDVYLIDKELDLLKVLKESKEVYIHNMFFLPETYDSNNAFSEIYRRQDVKSEMIGNYEHKQELMILKGLDYEKFCKNPAKNPTGTWIKEVNKIIPKTELKEIKKEHLLEGGKQDNLPECRLEANKDYFKGCVSGIVNGFSDRFAECTYCYASRQHLNPQKTKIKIDKQQLKEELLGACYLKGKNNLPHGKPINILRLGKRTEAGSELSLDSLVLTLETCLETGTSVVMPTKYYKSNKEINRLFKRTKSVVLFSICDDKFERGACSHGCNNEFRLEQVLKCKEQKVPSGVYLSIGLTNIYERELNVIKFIQDNNLKAQLLPMKLIGKQFAYEFTGKTWNILKRLKQVTLPGTPEENQIGTYYNDSGKLIPQVVHPYWKAIIGDNTGNIRMCHHHIDFTHPNSDIVYCGGCFLRKGFIISTPHIKAERRTNNRKADYKRKMNQDNKTLDLFELK
jgi:hypothetical protein